MYVVILHSHFTIHATALWNRWLRFLLCFPISKSVGSLCSWVITCIKPMHACHYTSNHWIGKSSFALKAKAQHKQVSHSPTPWSEKQSMITALKIRLKRKQVSVAAKSGEPPPGVGGCLVIISCLCSGHIIDSALNVFLILC